MCEFCREVRDDNEELIYSEINGECQYFTQIRYKNGEYRLYTVNCFRKIYFCPICGRKLISEAGKNEPTAAQSERA